MFGPKVLTDVFKVFIHSAALSKNCWAASKLFDQVLLYLAFSHQNSTGTAGLLQHHVLVPDIKSYISVCQSGHCGLKPSLV